MKAARHIDAKNSGSATGKVSGGRRIVVKGNDTELRAAKADIQNRSRWLVSSGRRSQASLCLFSSADVKAATIHYPDVDFD